jgi:PAS domain S-box-containing protein
MVESVVQSHAEIVVGSDEKKLIRVLHVDDELGLLKVAKQCLELQGPFQVDTAGCVEEALSKLKEKEYDAVVSDYRMPGKDGLEFLEMLRKNGNTIPFVMFTGKGREEVAVKAWSLGADHYVDKTGDPGTVYCELAHNIRQAVEKKRALEMRNVCQQRFLCLVENAAAGVGIFDPQGRFTYVNDALANLLGYPARELAGRHFGDFLHKEDKARILESFRQFSELETEPPTLEFRAVRKDGRLAYLMAKPTKSEIDGKIVGSQAIIVDITERKKMEQDLVDNQERLQRIFSASPDAITLSDINGNIVECNQTTLDILELSSKEELIGKSGFEFIPERDHQRVRENLGRTLEQGSVKNVEYTFLTKSGREIPTELSSSVLKDSSGKIVGFVSVAKDVTERKKAEEITKKSNEELKKTFDAISSFVFILDTDFRLVRVNKALCDALKKEPRELVGKRCFEILHGTDKPWPNCPHKKTLSTGQAATEEVNDPHLGCSLLVTNSPIRDSNGKLVGAVHVATDITERKNAEEALSRSEEKFRSLFDNANDAIIYLDGSGRILDVNRKTIEVFGGTREELIGKQFTEIGIFSIKETPELMRSFASILAGNTANLNVTIKNKKGQQIDLECSASPMKSDEATSMVVVARDVSERKKTEKTLSKAMKESKALRKSGIEVVGSFPWGTHLCQFYRTKDDLLETLVPYFSEGLRNNEYCMWVTSEPLSMEEAKEAMRKAVPDFDRCLERGQIEILPHTEWYLKDGAFNQKRVLDGWIDKLDEALAKGYDGLRLTGNTFWLEKKNWNDFANYENAVNSVIEQYKMIAICTYSLDKCQASEVIDVVSNHQFALIRKSGEWKIIESSEFKNAREDVRRSGEILRDVFACSPDAIMIIDLNGNVVDCNEAALRLMGYSSKEEIVGKNRLELIAEKDRESALKSLKIAFEQGPTKNVEYTFLKKNGEEYQGELSASVLRDSVGNPACFVGVIRDLTERKKAEEALRESEQRFRRLSEATFEAIAVHDKGKILDVNQNFAKMFGYELSEVIGKNAMDFAAPESRDLVLKNILSGCEKPYEAMALRKDGSTFVQETRGKAIPYEGRIIRVTAMRDITERKQWENALRDAKEKWSSLTENTDDIVMIVDGNGVIQYINRTIPPYTPEETVGKTVYEYVPREQHNVFEKSLREVFKTGEPYSYQVSSNIPKIGTIWFSTKVVPIKHDGKVSSAILISSNITDRKKAEEELRNSGERLSILFELAPDAYYLSDLKGNFIDGNKAAEKLSGYMRDELIGKSFLKLRLLPRNEALKAAKLLAMNALGKSTGPDVLVLNRKDGTQVPVEIRTHPIKIKDKTLVLGIARDITTRKKDEQAIRESHQKFEGLFRHNPEAAVYLDVNFKIVEVNPRFCQLFGYSAEEVKGKNINDVVAPEDMREEAEGLDKDAKNGHVSHNTVRKRKDGSLVHVSISAAPVTCENNLLGYVGIYKDITDLKRAQEESEESRRHFQMLFDLMADPVAVVDGRGKILEVTQKVEEITGFKKEELVGKNMMRVEMFGAKTKAVMIKSLAKRMMGMHVEPYEVEVLKKDGGKLMYEINAAKIDYKGKPADLVVFRDILERKNLEEKLRVVGGLTRHDVRNKLSAVTGNAYLLKRKLAGNPEALEQLADMENAVRNVEVIFEFARTYERLGVEKLVNMNVGMAVDEAASLFTDLKGIKIVNECHDLTVLADSLLRQLFYNLIDNTLKYGEKTGQIRIYSKTSSADKLELVYEDDGVGIPNDMRSSLFKEGFTSGKGTGYGLFMIKRAIEVYGWSIQETGIQGKGVKFGITIPKTNPNGKENYRIV